MKKVLLFTLLPLSLLLYSCSITSDSVEAEAEVEVVAEMLEAYIARQQIENLDDLDSDELKGEASESVQSMSFRSLIQIDFNRRILPDGTVVTITRSYDDNDTLDTKEDDTVFVSRSFEYEVEETRREELERPAIPEAEWNGWTDDSLIQNGIKNVFAGDIQLSQNLIEATWILDPLNIPELSKLEIDKSHLLRPKTRIEEVIEFDDDGLRTKNVTRFILDGSSWIPLHTFSFKEVNIGGSIYLKILRDDGSYILEIWEDLERIRSYYSADDTLLLVETISYRGARRESVTRDFYDESGNLIRTVSRDLSYTYGDGYVQIKGDVNGKNCTITITETDEGYLVEQGSRVYTAVFTDTGLEILNYGRVIDLLEN